MESTVTMAPITIGGNWVNSIKESIPDHAQEIRSNIDNVINYSPLDSIDTHAIAYVSALASGNGGLAFEIEMNGPLFDAEAEREAAKTVVALLGQNTVLQSFIDTIDDPNINPASLGLQLGALTSCPQVSQTKFEMYALTASIAHRSQTHIKKYYFSLKESGIPVYQLHHIGKIASVVGAIGKIAL